MLSQKNQITEKIRQAKNILLLSKQYYSGDDIATLLAWHIFLNQLGKHNDVVISDFVLKDHYGFLPETNNIKPNLQKLKKFTIAVDISQTKLDDFSYDIKDSELLLYLTPSKGFVNYQDVKFKDTNFKYDLIICLGVQDYEGLGKIHNEHADFFYQVPLINIDNNHQNEMFGNINEVDITKTSVAEMSYDIMQQINADVINKDIAQCLLTGIIDATKSFKTSTVNPQTLHLASDLINRGADRKEIIDKLFNTKSVSILKLWGRVLARLKIDNKYKIAWSAINQNDFIRSGAAEEDMSGVIEEIIMTSQTTEIAIIFYAQEYSKVKVYVYSSKSFDSQFLANAYETTGNKQLACFTLNKPIEEVEEEVIGSITRKLNNLLP
ncbi:MAG: DHH family phosphoesterase [Candidatus Komeilibacteria bacterium]